MSIKELINADDEAQLKRFYSDWKNLYESSGIHNIKPPTEPILRDIYNYCENAGTPGDFILGLLTNDLRRVFAHHDSINRDYIEGSIIYITNYMPHGSYGTPDLIYKWIEKRKIEKATGRKMKNRTERY